MTTKFDRGDKVYALDSYCDKNGNPIPIAIHIVIIDYILIDSLGIRYGVGNVFGSDLWVESIPEHYISKDINDLIPKLKL